MEVTMIEYKRLVNTGNFEHESLTVSVSLEPGESPHDAVKRAKAFVDGEMKKRPTEAEWASAKKILENPDNYRGYEVKQAQQVAALCESPDENPF
jgi:hypothetical protein